MRVRSSIMVSMNRLQSWERAQIVRALVEGNSIRSTVRITGYAKNTVTKLLVELGTACAAYQDEALRDLPATRIECDEIWSFVGMKAKSIPEERRGEEGIGDVWTWTALDPDSKLMCSWLVGERSPEDAEAFMADLAGRINHRVQITTDGFPAYVSAIASAFGSNVDYAMLVKEYGRGPQEKSGASPRRSSWPRRSGSSKAARISPRSARAMSSGPEPHHAHGDAPHVPA